MAEKNLLKRFVNEGDMLLGRVLETEKGREIYGKLREHILENISLIYDSTYCLLRGSYRGSCAEPQGNYAETHSLTRDNAKIVTWAMIQKAVMDCIHEELSD